MKMSVFGKIIEVNRTKEHWSVFYVGAEGKKRLAHDIIIPPELQEDELLEYVADLCHEWETKTNNKVERLKT